jgi:hypothetical protein
MPATFVDFVAPVDVALFFGVPFALMIYVFVQVWLKSRHHN